MSTLRLCGHDHMVRHDVPSDAAEAGLGQPLLHLLRRVAPPRAGVHEHVDREENTLRRARPCLVDQELLDCHPSARIQGPPRLAKNTKVVPGGKAVKYLAYQYQIEPGADVVGQEIPRREL